MLATSRYMQLEPSGEPGPTCEMDEWQLLMFHKVRRHCQIKVVSDGLSAEVLRQCNVEPATSVEQAVAESIHDNGTRARVAVIPKGPYVLPYLSSGPK